MPTTHGHKRLGVKWCARGCDTLKYTCNWIGKSPATLTGNTGGMLCIMLDTWSRFDRII
jgi:hypothetical protein